MRKIKISGEGVLIIPNEVKNIPEFAFIGYILRSLEIPEDVSIGGNAFSHYIRLTHVEIPKDVSIDCFAFSYCRRLTHIKISKDVSIGGNAFSYCTGLTHIKISKGVFIGNYAFEGCTGLSNIEIQESVSIGSNAFAGCTGLTHIKIPEGVSIGSSAFFGCTGLTHIKIPEGVSIGSSAFSGCTGLTHIKIPEGVSIGSSAFSGCTGLTHIKISKGASIATFAFEKCRELSSIKISKRVRIENFAFQYCIKLTNIEIQESVSIGNHAFYDCTGLAKVGISADQDLSAISLNPGVNVIRRAYYFIPSLPKRCLLALPLERDYNTFGIGKKLANLVLLCLHRNWAMESQIHGLPPEMGLMVLFFMNIEVFGREEVVIPKDKRLAVELLRPSFEAFEAFEALKQEKWFQTIAADPNLDLYNVTSHNYMNLLAQLLCCPTWENYRHIFQNGELELNLDRILNSQYFNPEKFSLEALALLYQETGNYTLISRIVDRYQPTWETIIGLFLYGFWYLSAKLFLKKISSFKNVLASSKMESAPSESFEKTVELKDCPKSAKIQYRTEKIKSII